MRASLLLAVLALGGCTAGGNGFFDRLFGRARPVAPSGPVHYVVGAPYQALGVWRYPREQFQGTETGLASLVGDHGARTTDDEAFDQTAMAAAHPTLQLPALALVTNLETGRQVVVRVNDRGPVPPTRLIALTRRAAELIGAKDGTQVRVRVLDNESRQLAAELQGDAGKLAVATAPTAGVKTESLAPPPGVGQGHARFAASAPAVVQAPPAAAASAIPRRLPEQVTQAPPQPGSLYVVAGTFGRLEYADLQRRRLGDLGARTVISQDGPRERSYRVEIGPLDGVANADATLGRVLGAGVSDARIVVQ